MKKASGAGQHLIELIRLIRFDGHFHAFFLPPDFLLSVKQRFRRSYELAEMLYKSTTKVSMIITKSIREVAVTGEKNTCGK